MNPQSSPLLKLKPGSTAEVVEDGSIWILRPESALPQLRNDLARSKTIYAWIYLLDPGFFEEVFSAPLATSDFFAVADHRQKPILRELTRKYPRFHPRTWAWNRTQHDKTILLPDLRITWLLTHNLTRGSWTLSSNRAARVASDTLAERMRIDFAHNYHHARSVLPL